jgi:hypothetical protein
LSPNLLATRRNWRRRRAQAGARRRKNLCSIWEIEQVFCYIIE